MQLVRVARGFQTRSFETPVTISVIGLLPRHIRVALHLVLASYGLVAAADSLRLPTMNSAVSEVPASCHFDLMKSRRGVTSEAVTSRHIY